MRLLILCLFIIIQFNQFCRGTSNNKNVIHTSNDLNKKNIKSDSGIYFSDIPQNDAEGSGSRNDDDDDDDDLDSNASGKGFDDEDSKLVSSGAGPTSIGNDPDDDLDLGSGDDTFESIPISSTQKSTKKTDVTKRPEKEKTAIPHPIDENIVPENVPHMVTTETSTKSHMTPSSTMRSNIHIFEDDDEEDDDEDKDVDEDEDDDNKLNNEVSIMGQKQVTPASFFARPGILAAVIGGAVVGLLCAILLVMFIVYRMRKKDEGSYTLDEPKRSPSANPYARGASKEFYA